MDFKYQEVKDLLEFFGGDEETEISVIEVKEEDPNHSGPGLYAYYSEYPDEGSMLLGSGCKKTHP
jgi:hypothetical protein